jgi:hypothetical protein
MDMIMADKMDQALLRVAEALLRHCEGKLCSLADLEEVLTFLKVDLPGEGWVCGGVWGCVCLGGGGVRVYVGERGVGGSC